LGVLLVENVRAQLAEQIGVVHEAAPPQTNYSRIRGGASGIQGILYGFGRRSLA
jgi:hypothetical protein